MSSKNSQCETFIPMLDAFTDNELSGLEKDEVSMHVQSCEACLRQVKEIEALKASLAKLPQRKMRVDLADSFDFAESKTGTAAPKATGNVIPLKRKWIITAASAAAIAVIAIAGSFVTMGSHSEIAGNPDWSNSANIAKHTDVAPPEKSQTGKPEVAEKVNPDFKAEHPAIKPDASVRAPEKIAEQPAVKKDDRPEKRESSTPDSHSAMAVVAHEESAPTTMQSNRGSTELLALYEDDDSSSLDIGVSTDEDGLYAIKL